MTADDTSPDPTDMGRLISTFTALGIPFALTDDSEESPGFDDLVDTVVVIEDRHVPVCFCFKRDGSFKDWTAFGGHNSDG